MTAGGVFRKGVWGRATNLKAPTGWEIFPEITESKEAASDHAAVWIDIEL